MGLNPLVRWIKNIFHSFSVRVQETTNFPFLSSKFYLTKENYSMNINSLLYCEKICVATTFLLDNIYMDKCYCLMRQVVIWISEPQVSRPEDTSTLIPSLLIYKTPPHFDTPRHTWEERTPEPRNTATINTTSCHAIL